jgi:hypothetical protein
MTYLWGRGNHEGQNYHGYFTGNALLLAAVNSREVYLKMLAATWRAARLLSILLTFKEDKQWINPYQN